ncbi:PREDICTED: zinc phosphodiesterase ELAC protein 2-like [Acropora digitifera]|uniref:zinc phosphodiesterase ELAC protein 2-like n=1 Tax=Acropora digitifera TaxID=70779 RepID=UPI00077A0277|nr:PREDICTED: zinc phosphodiesterase ELAC protein 2-like [Acropora digitifera]
MRAFFALARIPKKRPLNLMAASFSTKPSARVYLQVLGTETKDTSPSLFLFADSQRYLFNCGEGTQRIFNEHKLKLTKINNIFLTRLCWEYIGGLPGMAMTLRDNGKSDIRLNGPSNLSDFIRATRFFLHHESLKFDCTGYNGGDDESYEDENLRIEPVIINGKKQDAVFEASSSNDHTAPQDQFASPNDVDNDLPSSKKLKPHCESSTSVCYICWLSALPGKFFVKKALELGVPKGPLFGELQAGNTITLDDGIRLNGPSNLSDFIRATRFFLHHESLKFDCTGYNGGDDESYEDENLRIEPVIINGKKQDAVFEASSSNDHTAPQDQFASPNVVDNNLPSSKKLKPHCESSTSVCYICWLSALPGKFFVKKALELGVPKGPLFGELQAGNTITLDDGQQIKPEQVMGPSQPGPVFLIIDCPSTDFISSLVSNEHLSRHFEEGSCPTAVIIIHLTPMSVFESHEYVEWRNRFIICEERNGASPEFMVNKAQESQLNLNNYEVVFLGTGAALPSKYRNVSSTLIHMSDTASMLFDCGEGTYGQLYRHYGDYFSNRVLLRLKAVFISHIHADHHLGLIRILQKREILLPDERLLIIGPGNIGKWLHEYDTMCEDISYRFVDSSDLVVHRDGDYWNVYGHLQAQEILTVPVDHCTEAYGLVLKHQHGWKIVYSGDTRPCPELIEAGKDADLLIHEATLEDELKSEALSKMHSTTTEAIESGVKMEAKFIMLNHFSQRYPKVPMFSERFTKYTGIAFDHMRVHPRNFSRIPQLLEPLKTLFAEEIDEMVKK